MRRECDAVLVGVNTVLADDPQLTARDEEEFPLKKQPLRVILDSHGRTPPGARMLGEPGTTIIVTTPEVSAIRDADRVIGLLESSGLHRPKLIINRIAAEMVKRGDMMDQKDVESLLAVEVIGLVPADEHTVVAANRGIPVVHNPKSSAGGAFLRIAARVDGEDIPLMSMEPKTGLFSKFKGMVGMNGRAYSHA